MSVCIHHYRNLQRALNYNYTGVTISLLLGIYFKQTGKKGDSSRQGRNSWESLGIRPCVSTRLWSQETFWPQFTSLLWPKSQNPRFNLWRKMFSSSGRNVCDKIFSIFLAVLTLVMRRWLNHLPICVLLENNLNWQLKKNKFFFNVSTVISSLDFSGGSVVKNLPATSGDTGSNSGSRRSPGEMATYSNILAWEIPWTEDPSGLQSMQ